MTLRRYASSDSIGAFSITQDSVIAMWNVVLGISVMLWALGYAQNEDLFPRRAGEPRRRP